MLNLVEEGGLRGPRLWALVARRPLCDMTFWVMRGEQPHTQTGFDCLSSWHLHSKHNAINTNTHPPTPYNLISLEQVPVSSFNQSIIHLPIHQSSQSNPVESNRGEAPMHDMPLHPVLLVELDPFLLHEPTLLQAGLLAINMYLQSIHILIKPRYPR